MNNRIGFIIKGGLIATALMTVMMWVAPMMGMPKMSIGEMLAGFMKLPVAIGWIMHFMIGTILAAGYVLLFRAKLPGNDIVRGVLFGLIPFFMAQLVVMPMMGAGIFSSKTDAPMMMVVGSLVGHIVYGGSLGLLTREKK